MYNVSTNEIEKILIDTGVVILNYGETDERKLAPCEGDNSFVVTQEIRDIEYNGRRGKTKGLRRITAEDATLTVNLLNLSQANLKLALAGANLEAGTGVITNGDGSIPADDYLKNVTLVGETLDGEVKIITIYNAMADNGLSVTASKKGEAQLQVAFAAHYDPTNLASPIYRIQDVESVDLSAYDVTFTVTDGTNPIKGATVSFYGLTKKTDADGKAVFAGVLEGTNRAYTIVATGYLTESSAVTVDGDDEDVEITMVSDA